MTPLIVLRTGCVLKCSFSLTGGFEKSCECCGSRISVQEAWSKVDLTHPVGWPYADEGVEKWELLALLGVRGHGHCGKRFGRFSEL